MRNNQTEAERLIWSRLRRKQLVFQFRRQFGIDKYIVDFYCPEKKLVVELDGSFHRKRREYDKERTECLNRLGVRVLRFWNNEVIEDIDLVVGKIEEELVQSTPPSCSNRIPPLI